MTINQFSHSTNDQSALEQVEREHDCDSSTLFEIIFGATKKQFLPGTGTRVAFSPLFVYRKMKGYDTVLNAASIPNKNCSHKLIFSMAIYFTITLAEAFMN